jgi:hypothetical protein
VEEKTLNPQGGSYGTTLYKDKSTWLLCFSEFNLWLGLQGLVGVLFILGTSLLVGLNGLVLAQFDNNRVQHQCSLE